MSGKIRILQLGSLDVGYKFIYLFNIFGQDWGDGAMSWWFGSGDLSRVRRRIISSLQEEDIGNIGKWLFVDVEL